MGMNRNKVARELVRLARELVAAGKGPVEKGADWDEVKKWIKEAKRVSPKKITPARAKQLMSNYGGPMSPGYEHGMTQAEYSYVLQVWGSLPSSTSFNTAMNHIAKGKAAKLMVAARYGEGSGLMAGDWNEDADVDEVRDRAIAEFKKHTGGEKVVTAMKIKGKWFAFTTELGAYRLAKKYRKDWKDLGESKNIHKGTWYVKI